MKKDDKKKPAENKMQLQELQMHRRRADQAEKQLAAVQANLIELKRATPVSDVVAKDLRDSLVALLAAVENAFLDKDGKFLPITPADIKVTAQRARFTIRPPQSVQVEPASAQRANA